MNESIKFTADSPTGAYATDDTGTLVGFCQDHTERLFAIVRDTNNKYVKAPLTDIEYVSE